MEDYKYLYIFGANICALVVFYYKAFLSEKAKNQATKEDIEEITYKIEGVKADFTKQNEEVKATLNLSKQHILNIKNEERDAIIDYNKKINSAFFALTRFSYSSYDFSNYTELKIVPAKLKEKLDDSDLAEAHLLLFVTDREFRELSIQISHILINLESLSRKTAATMYYHYNRNFNSTAIQQFDLDPSHFAEMNTHIDEIIRNHTDSVVPAIYKLQPLISKIQIFLVDRLLQLDK